MKRFNFKHTILITFVIFLVGCKQDNGFEVDKKIYQHSLDGVATSLDPAKSSSVYSSFLVVNVFDTLFRYKYLARPYVLTPNLAASMPSISDDGLTYRIQIKEGVLFQDNESFPNGEGRELTAHDFVFSIKRIFDPKTNSNGKWLFRDIIKGLDKWSNEGANYSTDIEGLRAIDDYTIQIKLNKPYPQLLNVLATPYSSVVPKEAVEFYGDEFGNKIVGSGPFTLKSLSATKAILAKNTNYRSEAVDINFEGYSDAEHGFSGVKSIDGKHPPFVDKIHVNFIAEKSTRWNSFTKGSEIQFMLTPLEVLGREALDTKSIPNEIADKYHGSFQKESGFVYAGFNLNHPSFGNSEDPITNEKNRALRCAIRSVYNWPRQNRAFYGNIATVFPGVIPPVVGEFDPDLSDESIEYNPGLAKELLKDAGIKPSEFPEFEYHISKNSNSRLLFELLRGLMYELGYSDENISYNAYVSFAEYNRAIKRGEVPFFLLSWNLDFPDAQNTMQLFYGPNAGSGANSFNYKNPGFDRLYEQASVMQPSAERTKLYSKMNQMIIDECVVISGISRNRLYLWHKNVVMYPDRGILGGFFLKYVDV